MSEIFAILGVPDTDRTFVNVMGQEVVYGAMQEALRQMDSELEQAISLFVGETTEKFKRRYKLPGGGTLQRRGRQAPVGERKIYGQWDIAFPLEDFGDAIGGDDISLAYMTMQEVNHHLDTIETRNRNTVRIEILKALFNNTQWAFDDELHGTLNVEPLANGDAVVYPPILGAEDGATETHYAETGYTVANISDDNDPCETVVDELEEHFGTPQGGSEIAMFGGKTLCDKIANTLTDFVDVGDMHIERGDDEATVLGLPSNLPGKVRGRHESGLWVVEWRTMPANYSLSIHLNAPKPLVRRVDPADTGLGQGLQLVAASDKYPLQGAQYRHRFGFGVGNRLNGFVQKFGTSGSYSVPTGYTR